MPDMRSVDCPALHHRDESYPFGNRVPRTVRMVKTVLADPMPVIGYGYITGNVPTAVISQSFPAWTNSYGAVAAIMADGQRLGLKPDEFEVDTWHDSPLAQPDCSSTPPLRQPGNSCPGTDVPDE